MHAARRTKESRKSPSFINFAIGMVVDELDRVIIRVTGVWPRDECVDTAAPWLNL
jgi:hypothetical protein